MSQGVVHIIDARRPLERWAALLRAGTEFLYLGRDAGRLRALQELAGAGGRLAPLGARVGQRIELLRREYIGLDRHLAQPQDDLLWQASDLAERNPYTSSLLHDCCLLWEAQEHLREDRGPALVFVENPVLGLELGRALRNLGREVRHATGSGLLDALPWLLGPARIAELFRQAVSSRLWYLRSFCAKRAQLRGRLRPPASGDYAAVLTVWADGKSFPPGAPKERDAFWGELPGHARRSGARLLYLATVLDWVHPYAEVLESLRASPEAVLVPEACLGLGRTLWDLLRTLCWRPRRRRRFTLLGRDFESLFGDAVRQERAKPRQCVALKYLRVGAALARLGVRPESLLHLYENQPWEKMLRLGMRRALAGVRCDAFLHMPFSRQYLSFFPSGADMRAGLAPDRLLVPGEAWREIFEREGMPPERLEVCAALRHEHLFGVACGPAALGPAREVLVVGPLDDQELRGMLGLLAAVGPEFPQLGFRLKLHPTMAEEEKGRIRKDFLTPAAPWLRETSEPVPALLGLVGAVMYTSSAVCYEAVACGLATIFVGAEPGPAMDKLDWFPELRLAAHSAPELRAVLAGFLDQGPEEAARRSARAAAELPRLFRAVTPAGLDRFFHPAQPLSQPQGGSREQH